MHSSHVEHWTESTGSRWSSSGQFSHGFTTLQILAEIQNMMTEIKCEPEQFPDRIISMSMYNDIVWGEKGNKEMCVANSLNVTEYARRFAPGHWSFLGPKSEKKRYGTHTCKPNGEWD